MSIRRFRVERRRRIRKLEGEKRREGASWEEKRRGKYQRGFGGIYDSITPVIKGMDSRARPTIDCEEGEEGAGLMRGEGVHLEHGRRVRAYTQYCMSSYEHISRKGRMYLSPVRSVIVIKERVHPRTRKEDTGGCRIVRKYVIGAKQEELKKGEKVEVSV
jgi:hypothetical protein